MRLIQRQATGAPIEILCPTVHCLILLDALSIDGKRSYDDVRRSLTIFFDRLKSDKDIPYIVDIACIYAGETPPEGEAFDHLSKIKVPVPSDRPSPLNDKDLSNAQRLLQEAARRSEFVGRANLATILVVLTKESHLDWEANPEITYVWPDVSAGAWSAGLPKMMLLLAEDIIHAVDKELSWQL